MTADMQSSLRKLTSLSQNLNEASDKLTEELASVEAALKNLKLGVNAWVDVRTEDLGQGETLVCSLGYFKHKGKWGLYLYQCIDGMQPDGDVTPLREASRDLRIEAAEKIDALIGNLAKNASETTQKVTKRAEELKKIASALSDGRS